MIDEAFADEVRKHAEHHEELLRAPRRAHLSGSRRQVRKTQNRILRSFSSRLVALVRSLDKEMGKSGDEIRAMAKALDPFKDCGETIVAWAEPKASGVGWRPVCSFGPKRQALQTLCVDILMVKFGSYAFNYLAKGKGAERASDHLVDIIDQGYRHFVLADIENFFRSVQQGSLQEVTGLPEAVVRNCITISPEAHITIQGILPENTTPLSLDGAARSGLPQGSRASQLIASLLLGPALGQVASADRIVNFGDDVVVAAGGGDEAQALQTALTETLKSHPAGPFRLKRCEIAHADEGIHFLKYCHRRDGVTGKVWRRPSRNSYAGYERTVTKLVREHGWAGAVRPVARYRYLWMRSFRRRKRNETSKLLLWLTTLRAMEAGEKGQTQERVWFMTTQLRLGPQT